MTLGRKDIQATVFTALAVLVFAATHQGWNVWLIGDSHRWAAAAIGILGMLACVSGSPQRGATTRFLAALGVVTLVLLVVSLVTGSLTWLSLTVATMIVLWLGSTIEHVGGMRHHPAAG